MRFGVNYIPSKNWLYSWIDFDETAMKEDLKTIKGLGFDHIRAHILWSYFQPNENKMSAHCMNNLKKFCDACDEVGLDFFLSVFTGWMSGFVFLPSWLNVGCYEFWRLDIFSNERAIKAEKFLIEELAKVVTKSKSFLGFDLGNELNVLTRTPLDKNLNENIQKSIEVLNNWCKIMYDKCYEVAPNGLHCNGVDHGPWFGNFYFSRERLANDGFATQFHAWGEFTGTAERYGWNDNRMYSLPHFMTELSKAYTEKPNERLFQVQEFGAAKEWIDDSEVMENYIRNTLDFCAQEPNMWGVTWWCSHDISREFTGFNELEYTLGLIDIDNNPKPAGLIFKKYIEEYKAKEIKPYKPTKALVVKETGFGYAKDARTNADRYAACVEKGIYPAFVLPEKVNDTQYLKMRGIEEILDD